MTNLAPLRSPRYLEETQRHEADQACAQLDFWRDHFVEAESAEVAWEGMSRLQNVLEQSAAGSAEFTLTCPDARVPCAELMSPVRLEQVGEIRTCYGEGAADRCWKFWAGDQELRVWSDATHPNAISKVEIREMLVMWHERID